MTRNNNLLGTFDLTGLTPVPRGVPKIDVTFDLDADGILNVTATDTSSGRRRAVTIRNERGRLSRTDIERMLADAERYRGEDERCRERVAARNRVEGYVLSARTAFSAPSAEARVPASELRAARTRCERALSWLERNAHAPKQEYEFELRELQRVCAPVLARLQRTSFSNDYDIPYSSSNTTSTSFSRPRQSAYEVHVSDDEDDDGVPASANSRPRQRPSVYEVDDDDEDAYPSYRYKRPQSEPYPEPPSEGVTIEEVD